MNTQFLRSVEQVVDVAQWILPAVHFNPLLGSSPSRDFFFIFISRMTYPFALLAEQSAFTMLPRPFFFAPFSLWCFGRFLLFSVFQGVLGSISDQFSQRVACLSPFPFLLQSCFCPLLLQSSLLHVLISIKQAPPFLSFKRNHAVL